MQTKWFRTSCNGSKECTLRTAEEVSLKIMTINLRSAILFTYAVKSHVHKITLSIIIQTCVISNVNYDH